MSLNIILSADTLTGRKSSVFSDQITGTGYDAEVIDRGNIFTVTGLPAGLTSSQAYGGDSSGTVTADAGTDLISFAAHGLEAGRRIQFTSTGVVPAPLVAGTTYYVCGAGYGANSFKVTATYGGSAIDLTDAGTGTHTCVGLAYQLNTLQITGTPTEAGVFVVDISYSGYVSGVPSSLTEQVLLLIEGDGYLQFYHVDHDATPDEVRPAIDLQYNVRTREFDSAAFDVADGLTLRLGEIVRLHALVSRNGVYTLTDGTPSLPATAPSDLSLVVRPKNMRDAAPFIRASVPDGTENMAAPGGTDRPVAYFDLEVGDARLRRIFRQLNAAAGPDTASIEIDCEGEIAFTLDGRRHVSPPFSVKLAQPYNR